MISTPERRILENKLMIEFPGIIGGIEWEGNIMIISLNLPGQQTIFLFPPTEENARAKIKETIERGQLPPQLPLLYIETLTIQRDGKAIPGIRFPSK